MPRDIDTGVQLAESEPQRRPIALTGLRTLADGRKVNVYVDIDDRQLDDLVTRMCAPAVGSPWHLPIGSGALVLRVVEV